MRNIYSGRTLPALMSPIAAAIWIVTSLSLQVLPVHADRTAHAQNGDVSFGNAMPRNITRALDSRELPANVTLDYLLTLTFSDPASCGERVLQEWRLNLTNLELYCVCYKICVDRTLSGDHLEEQRRAVLGLMDDYHRTFPGAVRAMVAVYIIILILGILGNSLVLLTVLWFLKQTSVTNIFICSLACADLLVVCINIPMKIWQIWVGYWYMGKVMCHVMHYLLYMTFLASVLTLTAMSIERYMAICRPLQAQYVSTPGRARRIACTIWILSLLLGLPTIFVTNHYENTWVCNLVLTPDLGSQIFVSYLVVIQFLVPTVVMGTAYIRMSVTLLRTLRSCSEMQSSYSAYNACSNRTNDTKGRLQVIRMLATVWVVFAVCWTPFMGTLVSDAFGGDLLQLPLVDHALMLRSFTCLAYSNSCLNPLLYAFFSAHFRRGFAGCFLACFSSRRRQQTWQRRWTFSEKSRMCELSRLSRSQSRSSRSSRVQLGCGAPSNIYTL